jgi:hypothetical protein
MNAVGGLAKMFSEDSFLYYFLAIRGFNERCWAGLLRRFPKIPFLTYFLAVRAFRQKAAFDICFIALMEARVLGRVEHWHGKHFDKIAIENASEDTIESSLHFKSCDPDIVIFYTLPPPQLIEREKTIFYKVSWRPIDDSGAQNFLTEVSAKQCEVTVQLKSRNPCELAEQKHILKFIRGSTDSKVELFFNVSLMTD